MIQGAYLTQGADASLVPNEVAIAAKTLTQFDMIDQTAQLCLNDFYDKLNSHQKSKVKAVDLFNTLKNIPGAVIDTLNEYSHLFFIQEKNLFFCFLR
tara:strand:- start:952 stop:1242 length:291 start_codon:yes stop_codon:yes gene_type:complete